MKVLLVDDEIKFARMLTKRLALRGFDVDYVHAGEEALGMIEEKNYNVAILDVKMPGIGGIELQRKLKALVPGIKTIFLTGHGSKTDFETGTAEAAFYLAKPIKIEKLIEILNELAG